MFSTVSPSYVLFMVLPVQVQKETWKKAPLKIISEHILDETLRWAWCNSAEKYPNRNLKIVSPKTIRPPPKKKKREFFLLLSSLTWYACQQYCAKSNEIYERDNFFHWDLLTSRAYRPHRKQVEMPLWKHSWL